MAKKKLNYVDKGINTTVLTIITIIVGLLTIVALATNYILGVISTIILMIFAKKLVEELVDFDKFIDQYIRGRKW